MPKYILVVKVNATGEGVGVGGVMAGGGGITAGVMGWVTGGKVGAGINESVVAATEVFADIFPDES